jgi:dUTPase
MNQSLTIKFGGAIAQLIPVKRVEMDVTEVDNETIEKLFKEQGSIRGAGGFGSTSGM